MKRIGTVEVKATHNNESGFRVVLSVLPGGDELWETYRHFALFADHRDAERLAAKIERVMFRAPEKMDLRRFWSRDGGEKALVEVECFARPSSFSDLHGNMAKQIATFNGSEATAEWADRVAARMFAKGQVARA